ncbi:MAG: hypothetical protein ACO3EE_00330 [Flavobacteriales bacterium]
MKEFLQNSYKFFRLLCIIWVSIIAVNFGLAFGIKEFTNSVYYKFKKIEEKSVLVMGDSHPECAINNKLMGMQYLSLCKSGEPLFYTAVKADKVLSSVAIDTVIVEVGLNAFKSIDWVLGDEHALRQFKKYGALLNSSQHQFLFDHIPSKYFKGLFSITPVEVAYYALNADGGYNHLVAEINKSKLVTKADQNQDENRYADSLQEYNSKALFQLIQKHPKTYFILITCPVYPGYYSAESNTAFAEKISAQAKQNSNCTYKSFSDLPLADSCFADRGHLNFKGAKIFSKVLRNYLELR